MNAKLNIRFPQEMEFVKNTGKKLLEIPRRRFELNIRMNFKEMGVNIRNWVD